MQIQHGETVSNVPLYMAQQGKTLLLHLIILHCDEVDAN